MQPIGEIFGYIGGTLGVLMALPQALHIRRRGNGYGVSLTMWLLTLLVNASWLGYGIKLGSPSLVISNIVGFTTSAFVVSQLVNKGWWIWPAMYIIAAAWAGIEMSLPLEFTTVLLIALTFYRFPQILRSVKNLKAGKETSVSLRALFIGLGAISSWEVYSVLSGHPQLVLTTSIALTMTSTIVLLELVTLKLSKKKQVTA